MSLGQVPLSSPSPPHPSFLNQWNTENTKYITHLNDNKTENKELLNLIQAQLSFWLYLAGKS